MSALALALGGLAGLMPREAASAQVLAFGLVFGLTAFFIQMHDAWLRSRAEEILPQEAKILKVERKARLIRGQIEESERRLKSLAQLYEAAKKLVGILELTPLMDEARTVVGRALPEHFGPQVENESRLAFYIPQDENSDYQRMDAHGHEVPDEGLPGRLAQEDLRRWIGDAFNPIRVRDLEQDIRFREFACASELRSVLIVPLVVHEILVGVMILATERLDGFSASDFNQACVLGKQVVFALRKALLYRKVQILSITDNLTGLYVHRYFQERFQEELDRAERYRHGLALILLDLDNFKCVNDEYGHPTGDAVLAEAAARIREAAGSAALVARYGGEEFAVILPGMNWTRALEVAREINLALKATPIDIGGARLTVTISGGVSTYPEDALVREALITAADTALYEAKRGGRDQIACYAREIKEKNI